MIKKLISLALVLVPFITAAQQKYTVVVNVKNVNPEAKAYLNYMVNQHVYEDSAALANHRFVFKGEQATPMKAFVILSRSGKPVKNDPDADKVAIYLENGTVTVNAVDSLVNATVGGPRLNTDQQQVAELLQHYTKQTKTMVAAYDNAKGNASVQEKIKADYAELEKQKSETVATFVKSHSSSLVSLNLLLTNVDPAKDVHKALALFNSLSPELQQSANGKVYKAALSGAETVDVGAPAPEFMLKNVRNEEVSLSAFRGKYVLVDFWASWCAPCRAENPNVVKAFEKYKNKNFTVLGISLDAGEQAKEKWMQAIAKDQLPWEQVADLRGWQSPVAQRYEVRTIPANFLIDPSGKIIGKDLHGAALDQKLAALFK